MKKLILAGIVVIIGCLIFIIIQQNSSQADIGRDIFHKPYYVTFGDWVYVDLFTHLQQQFLPHFHVVVSQELIESKMRFRIEVRYNLDTE